MPKSFKTVVCLFFIAAGCVYILGMLIPIMEVDAAQYASITQQLLEDGNYLQVKDREFNYLDKPPLLFWMAAGSVSLFGTTSFAYKLPSVLILLLAIFSTYKFSRLHNNKAISLLAALIVTCSQAFFIMANDCRTDNLLLGFSMLAIWKLASYLKGYRPKDLYIGFVAIGLAMLAKGPLGLIFPFFVIGIIMLIERKQRPLSWRWLWAIPIIAVILTPMCIGLYQQHGSKGLEFFFWTQSFGRITGQSRWSNNTDPFFLVHSFLWAFLPFTLVFISATYSKVRLAIKKQPLTWMDYGNIGGFILTMFALSLSRYRLPHYIYIVSPIAAILCAQHLATLGDTRFMRRLERVQYGFMSIIVMSAIGLVYVFTESFPWLHLGILAGILALIWVLYSKFASNVRIVFISAATILFVNIILNSAFYPALLRYQAPSEAAFHILEQNVPQDRVVSFHIYGHAFPYYLNKKIKMYGDIDEIKSLEKPVYVYTNQRGLDAFKNHTISHRVLKRFDNYKVSILTSTFINPPTRKKVLSEHFLVHLKGEE